MSGNIHNLYFWKLTTTWNISLRKSNFEFPGVGWPRLIGFPRNSIISYPWSHDVFTVTQAPKGCVTASILPTHMTFSKTLVGWRRRLLVDNKNLVHDSFGSVFFIALNKTHWIFRSNVLHSGILVWVTHRQLNFVSSLFFLDLKFFIHPPLCTLLDS